MISQASRERLIVALDVEDVATARALTQKLGDTVVFYKIGMELAYGGGLDLAAPIASRDSDLALSRKPHVLTTTTSAPA